MQEFQQKQKIKNIALNQTTYTLLSNRGKKGETFDKIVLKLLGEKEENEL